MRTTLTSSSPYCANATFVRALTVATIVLAGCQSTYTVPSGQPRAEISASAQTDPSVTNARWVWLESFADESCKENKLGIRLGSSPAFSNAGTVSSPPHKIVANQKLTFTTAYMDARYAQNRKCAVTASFTPQVDHRYQAVMQVNDAVTECGLGLYDVTANTQERVSFTMPEHACLAGDKDEHINGKPMWTTWTINATVSPAPAN